MSRSAALAAVLVLLPAAACTMIGPTVATGPGPGKSPAAFDANRRDCMAEADRHLQPIANRINTLGTPLAQVAANNRQLQADYDRGFAGCMMARGEIVEGPPVQTAVYTHPAALPPSAATVVADGATGRLPGGGS